MTPAIERSPEDPEAKGRFSGQVAVVTGSSRGIGFACARRLAAEGAAVVVNGVDAARLARAEQELRADGARVEAVCADVLQDETADRLVAAATERFGRLDVLVANVGGAAYAGPASRTPRADWTGAMERNTWPALDLVRAACDAGFRDGAVIVMSSVGSRLNLADHTAYNAGKVALELLTRSLARELGPAGIRVNAVAPGVIVTGMSAQWAQGDAGARRAAHLPLRRLGHPEDVAGAVAFLASSDAAWITGVTLDVDGGYLTVGPPAGG